VVNQSPARAHSVHMEAIPRRPVCEHRDNGHCGDDAVTLLARVTSLPHGALRVAIGDLPDDQRERLDALAGEILEDARACRTFAYV
jgi:hypothetical protein